VTTSSTDAPEAPDEDHGPHGGERQLDPRLRMVWTIQAALGVAVVVVLVLAGEIVARMAGLDSPVPTGLAAAVLAVLGGLAAWWLPATSWRNWRFELAPDALELRHGVLVHVHSAIPYGRVQYIDIRQGPIERALGLSRLVVHTAAAASDAELPGIASPEAEGLRRALLARAGVGDAV
jgi:membrane protein YdbS with pleckstrin-like domain